MSVYDWPRVSQIGRDKRSGVYLAKVCALRVHSFIHSVYEWYMICGRTILTRWGRRPGRRLQRQRRREVGRPSSARTGMPTPQLYRQTDRAASRTSINHIAAADQRRPQQHGRYVVGVGETVSHPSPVRNPSAPRDHATAAARRAAFAEYRSRTHELAECLKQSGAISNDDNA